MLISHVLQAPTLTTIFHSILKSWILKLPGFPRLAPSLLARIPSIILWSYDIPMPCSLSHSPAGRAARHADHSSQIKTSVCLKSIMLNNRCSNEKFKDHSQTQIGSVQTDLGQFNQRFSERIGSWSLNSGSLRRDRIDDWKRWMLQKQLQAPLAPKVCWQCNAGLWRRIKMVWFVWAFFKSDCIYSLSQRRLEHEVEAIILSVCLPLCDKSK